MNKKAITPLILLCLMSTSIALQGATIFVPDDYPAIQDAIDAAVSGDEIIVKPGTYPENIDYDGKAITVKSEQGPEVTIIDPTYSSAVVRFWDDEGPGSILDGFTLKNGKGIYDFFTQQRLGGGIYCDDSSPTIRNNIITENSVSSMAAAGGGIYCNNSSPLIENNKIVGNQSGKYGGGIFCENNSAPIIENNLISENTTIWSGGGISLDYSPATVTGNVITKNDGGEVGGGIDCMGSSVTVNDNIITNNICNDWGGGVFSLWCTIRMTNNVIARNSAGQDGGGVHCGGDCGSPRLTNNTIVENTAGSSGGGLCCDDDISLQVANTIMWQNTAALGPQIALTGAYSFPTVNISYSDAQGGQTQAYVAPGSTLNWGAGMLDSDPMIVGVTINDWHIIHYSPCKDAGNNNAPLTPSEDFEGDPRTDSTVDIGADEFHPHLYFTGSLEPGGRFDVRICGEPNTSPVTLARGPSLQDPPQSTLYGDLYLQPPFTTWNFGMLPTTGILVRPATVPSHWQSGDEAYFQVLLGPQGNPSSILTNLAILYVE